MDLLNAVKGNEMDLFKTVIKQIGKGSGSNLLNAVDENNNTPLNLAAQIGSQKMVKALLSKGADANVANNVGKTPLSYAAQKGAIDVVKSLMKSGADPNLKDVNGSSPLLDAIQSGIMQTVTGSSQQSSTGNKMMDSVVKYLIKGGADVNTTDNHGNSPLTLAAKGGSLDTVKMLCAKGADLLKPDASGKTPLQYAQEGNYGEVANIIGGLAQGSMNIKDLMSGPGGNLVSSLMGGNKGLLDKCTIL